MKKLFLTLLAACFIASAPLSSAAYDDVDSSDPGVTYLELIGVLDAGDAFRPDDLINRAEAFAILFRVLGEETSVHHSQTFADVPQGAWFAPYVELGLRYGLLDSRDTHFEPSETLRKSEVLELLAETYGVGVPYIPSQERERLFLDVGTTHPHYNVIHALIEMGLIDENSSERFYPFEQVTRSDYANWIKVFDEWNTQRAYNGQAVDFYNSGIFADVWKRIFNSFYLETGQVIDPDLLFQAAIKGMLFSLGDEYTTYYSPDEAEQFSQTLEGDFVGIGVLLIQDPTSGEVSITEVLDDTPADGKLEAGDVITHVDNVAITGFAMESILDRIGGEVGTTVSLRIRRNGLPIKVDLTREAIQLVFIDHDILYRDTWYLDIDVFSSGSSGDAYAALLEMKEEVKNPEALIIDMRGNIGGLVDQAVALAAIFLPKHAPVVTLDFGDYDIDTLNSSDPEFPDVPIYILTDGFTASSAEIFTAALQDNERATVVGTQTFGKGSAQQVTTYWDGSMLKLTIAHWLTPNGHSLQDGGILPDVEVTGSSETLDLWLEQVKKLL